MNEINTKLFEDLRLSVYIDNTGHKTIGYGHDLDTQDGKSIIENQHLNYDAICNGSLCISEEEADKIYDQDMAIAKEDAISLVPELLSMPQVVQEILCDLSFNMGKTRLSGFKRAIAAFNNWDWKSAADELYDSNWYEETGRRAEIIVDTLDELADGS